MSSGRGNYPLTFRLQVIGDAEVQNKFKGVATAMGQLDPAAKKVTQSTKQVQTTLTASGKAAETSSTGFKNYGGALTTLGSHTTHARSSTDAFSGSLTNLSKSNAAAVGGLNETNTVTNGLVPSMQKLGNEGNKTQGKMAKLTEVFRGK